MKKHMLLTLPFLMAFSGPTPSTYQIKGSFLGQHIQASVDHPLAAHYFKESLQNSSYAQQLDSSLEMELSKIGGHPLTEESMAFLSKKVSVDFATIYLTKRLYSEHRNKFATVVFRQIDNEMATGKSDLPNTAKQFDIVFVPGLFYQRHPETGGDFAAQIKLLQSLGMNTHLIRTNEMGSVKENANIIKEELKRLRSSGRKTILVSASKADPTLPMHSES